MSTNLPDAINVGKNPDKPGVYVCVVGTNSRDRQYAACCKWDGNAWAVWTRMFDPPEWDPVEFQNCYVVSWVTAERAMRAALLEGART